MASTIKKYKCNLKKRILEERLFKEKQEGLKDKYDVVAENVVIVEKSNMFKFAVKAFSTMIRVSATILLLALAFAGLVAIVYPEPRAELLALFNIAREQLYSYLRS